MAKDPYRYYRVEAREILEGLGRGLLELEKGSAVSEVVARLFRLAHTLKGASRVVKQKEIADLAHAFEDALEPHRSGATEVTREVIDGLLAITDAMTAKLASLAVPEAAAPASPEPGATPATSAEPPAEAPERSLASHSEELDTLVEGVAELGSEVATIRRGAGALERAQKLAETLQQRFRLRAVDAPATAARLHAASEELVGLLSTANREMSQGVERLERELRQVGEAAERLRLVPASAMFGALERAARDAGVSTGKRVELETTGGDVRLEPSVVAVVQGALVQAVRNAVAHGIEPEGRRQSAGKEPTGRISVGVARRGSSVRFLCRDDGSGVHFAAVRSAAVRRGAPGAELERLDEGRLLELLLAGGISTSGAVTTVAGRGVGLDVVREAAVRLGGSAKLRSKAGSGTELELVVPISRSALDALVVESDGTVAAIPLDAVRRTLRVRSDELTRSAEGDSLVLEGVVVPFAPLGRSLRSGASTGRVERAWSTVLVESRGVLAAVGVDRLLGTETIVAQPLPEGMPGHAAVAGTMLDADGNPRLVLDSDGLVAGTSAVRRLDSAEQAARAPILVIDDSLTTRMLEQSILESAGFEVELAVSAEEGMEKARRRRYALFLVDVEMPGMDGFTFVERTRADTVLREVPAILVTSRSSDDDKKRGENAGASAYIVKGEFDQGVLLARIRELVG